MYFFGILCLLLAVEALPTPEQVHINEPAPPSPLELKPDEKDNNIEVLVDPVPPVVEEPGYSDKESKEKVDEFKKELEAVEKPKEEKEREEIAEQKEVEKEKEKEVKDKFEGVVVVEESNDPNEKPNDEEPKEEKKDEESKDEDVEEGPIIVQIFKPKPFLADIFSQFFPGFQWPHFSLPDFLRPRSADPLELDEPIYIVKESDFSWPYKK
ncbi:DNA ligase 1-like [Spodoptera litura]|uniref:DNA ligase 1-like n=1 Tax=Spodoptera litura TaxID=69820 RepID=A0A9J7IIK3_SPOLT|nr:DNA ligase 1-like [Spodoptera litura]